MLSYSCHDKECYLNLGEIYDSEFKKSEKLQEFNHDLTFLYPFKFHVKKNKISNIEDILFFQKKYKLTKNIKLYGKVENRKKIIFKTPILYDLTNMKIIRNQDIKNQVILHTQPSLKEKIIVVIPNLDPIGRGILLENVLEYKPFKIILFGKKEGKNTDETSTLMTRFLLSRNYPKDSIIKIKEIPPAEFILEKTKNTENCYIGCLSSQIFTLTKLSRIMKIKTFYICPFYGSDYPNVCSKE